MILDHKYFQIEYSESEKAVWINLFHIKDEYRGKRLSYSIWLSLSNYFKKDIGLICFWTLINYYKKIGFNHLGLFDDQGYHEMEFNYIPERNKQLIKLT